MNVAFLYCYFFSLTGAKFLPTAPSVIIIQYPLGKMLEQEIPPQTFWRTQFYMPHSQFVKFNFTLPSQSVIGVYGRKNIEPSHTQYDFFHVMDGSKIVVRSKRATQVNFIVISHKMMFEIYRVPVLHGSAFTCSIFCLLSVINYLDGYKDIDQIYRGNFWSKKF